MMQHQVIIQQLEKEGLLPLFHHAEAEVCKNILVAFYNAGNRIFEYTNRHAEALPVFRQLKKFCEENLPGMMLGAGTIKTGEDATAYLDAGAAFLVSPCIEEDVNTVVKQRNALWLPGVATASEIRLAEKWNINYVKIFPALQLGGPAYIKAVKAVFPYMNMLVTGGVTTDEASLKKWFEAGVSAVGIGSNLIQPSLIESKNYEAIQESVRQMLQTLANIKNH
jgi:2-dehydro-3-deoxyphosphogluconate aldolase/(4S)-4-hydroxy-2-oxoglutarate aldolase